MQFGSARQLNKPNQGGDQTKKEYIITLVLLAVLVACSAPASAQINIPCCECDVKTAPCCGIDGSGTNGTIDGTVYVGGGNYKSGGNVYGPNTVTQDFDVPSGTIKWSRLYYHVWGGNPQGHGLVNVTFKNATGGSVNHSYYCMNNTNPAFTQCNQNESEGLYVGGYGTHWLYWNVTNYTTSGFNSATIRTNQDCTRPNCPWDGRVMWVVLVTVVENNTQPSITYTINQGRRWLNYTDWPTYTTHTSVFYGGVNTGASHTLYALALASNDGMKIHFNNHLLEDIDVPPYDSIRKYCINTGILNAADNEMRWEETGGGSHAALAVFYEGYKKDPPDLVVEEKVIEHLSGTCSGQTATEYVVCHTYDVDVRVKNIGLESDSGAFNVCLYDNGNRVDTVRVNGLGIGKSKWVTLQWHPTTAGTHTLRVMADNDYEVTELVETNNNITQSEAVLLNDATQPDLYPEIYPKPAWRSNRTEIVVRAYNNGTTDASNSFNVNATMVNASGQVWTNSSVWTSVCAKAYQEIVYTTNDDLVNCSDYTVTVVLDTTNTVAESNELNNTTSKVFHAVDVRLKVTHHYGNTSDYSGQLTGSASNVMGMIDVARVVPNCTTPYDLLNSEADTIPGPAAVAPYIYGINNSAGRGTSTWYLNESGKEDETCAPSRPIYWYCIINGVPTPNMPAMMNTYTFSKPGDVMRMDLLKYVNSGQPDSFRPRLILDFPEPFLHGYEGTVWATTIVEPSNGNYATEAAAIRTRLIGKGVANVNIRTTATVTPTEKQSNNLILLGTPQENNLIAEINASHTGIGMPVYFNDGDPDNPRPGHVDWLIDDWLYPQCKNIKNSSYHGVVMACDNPYDNAQPWTDTWMDADTSVWIASGVTPCYAKRAAGVLASDPLNEFWNVSRNGTRNGVTTDGCGDMNGDCTINTVDLTPLCKRIIATGDIVTSEWAGDIDCSCNIDTIDLTLMCKHILGASGGPFLNCCG